MDHALAAAKARGHGAVILLGDAPYYARFGFSAAKTGELSLPGPFERDRLLGLELREGALDGAWGMIVPTGAVRQSGNARKRRCGQCRARPERRSCRQTTRRAMPELALAHHHHRPADHAGVMIVRDILRAGGAAAASRRDTASRDSEGSRARKARKPRKSRSRSRCPAVSFPPARRLRRPPATAAPSSMAISPSSPAPPATITPP